MLVLHQCYFLRFELLSDTQFTARTQACDLFLLGKTTLASFIKMKRTGENKNNYIRPWRKRRMEQWQGLPSSSGLKDLGSKMSAYTTGIDSHVSILKLCSKI